MLLAALAGVGSLGAAGSRVAAVEGVAAEAGRGAGTSGFDPVENFGNIILMINCISLFSHG